MKLLQLVCYEADMESKVNYRMDLQLPIITGGSAECVTSLAVKQFECITSGAKGQLCQFCERHLLGILWT